MDGLEKRPLMISRGWIQAAIVILMFGFFILGILTYYTYNDEPPIPGIVKAADGSTLFTRADIMAGQQVFLGNGLMEWLNIRARCVSGPGLHGGIPASRGAHSEY